MENESDDDRPPPPAAEPFSDNSERDQDSLESSDSDTEVILDFKWKKKEFSLLRMHVHDDFPAPPYNFYEHSPFDYYKMFIGSEMFHEIANQANLHSVYQLGRSINTDASEISRFFGILYHMCIVKMPQYRMYWSAKTRYPPVADVMTRDRFEVIRRWLHFNDNTKTNT
jgi:hypothetical protein